MLIYLIRVPPLNSLWWRLLSIEVKPSLTVRQLCTVSGDRKREGHYLTLPSGSQTGHRDHSSRWPRGQFNTCSTERDPFFPREGLSFMAVKLQTSGMHMSKSAARKPSRARSSESGWTMSLPVQLQPGLVFRPFKGFYDLKL